MFSAMTAKYPIFNLVFLENEMLEEDIFRPLKIFRYSSIEYIQVYSDSCKQMCHFPALLEKSVEKNCSGHYNEGKDKKGRDVSSTRVYILRENKFEIIRAWPLKVHLKLVLWS